MSTSYVKIICKVHVKGVFAKMVSRKQRLPLIMTTFLLTIFLLLNGGCLPKPYLPGNDPGTLRLRLYRAETFQTEQFTIMAEAASEPIAKLLIKLTNNKLFIEKTVEPYQEDQIITIDSLYPGTWKIQVFAYDAQNDWLFYGELDQPILPGKTAEAFLKIGTAPGWVEVSMDVTTLRALGIDTSKGRFYVYEDPESDASTQFDLVLEGNYLKNSKDILLKEGTYEAHISIPNKSNPVYESYYERIDAKSGEVLEIKISADAELIIEGVIDANPPTPDNFQIILIGDQLELSWELIEGIADLAGYNIYRTNREGRFVFYTQVAKEVSSYRDNKPKAEYYFNNRLGYAVSSFDLGGNNSIWTEPGYLYLENSPGCSLSKEE